MGRTLRIAIGQIDPTVGDLSGNAAVIRKWLGKAERAQADIAVFPELAITGYPPEDLVFKRHFVDHNIQTLRELAKKTSTTAAVVGFVDREGQAIYNAAAMLAGGRVRGVARKAHLPNYGVFDEVRTFRPGAASPLFVVRGVTIGLVVCEDAWFPEPCRTLGRLGAEVIVSINASPYHRGKDEERRALFSARATESKAFFVYAQTVGGQDELVFDGDSLIFNRRGEIVARGAQFAEDMVLYDIELPEKARALSKKAVVVKISGPKPVKRIELPRQPRQVLDPIGEVYAALVLGTRDYVFKNGFKSAVIGLSGGIDSALTAVVAADAIGVDNVTGVSMPSPYSSNDSFEDAKDLAGNLGIGFAVIPISALMESFRTALGEVFAGRPSDVTEENLQSRIRGNILMALSNKFGHLVLATGNKSEMATGYSTLYGDLAGGFAVLKDVPKTLVYKLAGWRNDRGPAAIPDRVMTKAPTAELRPEQLDVDSLPPYERLDPILFSYIEEHRSFEEIVAKGSSAEEVRRVLRLVDTSEYKRRQAPPGVKITRLSFGKDRRLPITNRYREGSRPAPARAAPGGPRAESRKKR
ncbi:MAG: NAD+ synthase [Actinomycetota bacterium]|nr:NAD+ synthase [Actinomycetota bacterium]